ncbi:MAG TPA: site-2 protease family protein [Gammaproteobacteria bacterium]|nr:site-2 protease family protein [Gammaproteobacteria bacterium]
MLDAGAQNFLLQLSVLLIPGIFAITLHEVAHGLAAKRLGDPTAYMLGRLSLNPLKHVDPMGTIIVPLAMYFLGGIVFGWAKPVPVSFRNLRNPKRDMVLVAAAGPAANFAMALGWAVLAGLVNTLVGRDDVLSAWVVSNCNAGILLNVGLGTFNLLPIPPLDGGRVLSGLLPPNASRALDRIEPFGFIILIVLLIAPGQPLFRLLAPFFGSLVRFYSHIAGLA